MVVQKREFEGSFITIEGLDGVGKTTQSDILSYLLNCETVSKYNDSAILKELIEKREDVSLLQSQLRLLNLRNFIYMNGKKVVFSREPGGTIIAEEIRRILLATRISTVMEEINPLTEAYLFAASRAQHTAIKIIPVLEQGNILFSDRYIDSSLSYQGVGRGLGIQRVYDINREAMQGVEPDLTFYLKQDFDKWIKRIEANSKRDRIERNSISFFQKLYEGSEEIIKMFPDRIRVINVTDKTIGDVAVEISSVLEEFFRLNYREEKFLDSENKCETTKLVKVKKIQQKSE